MFPKFIPEQSVLHASFGGDAAAYILPVFIYSIDLSMSMTLLSDLQL
jgi:hypothetical protein